MSSTFVVSHISRVYLLFITNVTCPVFILFWDGLICCSHPYVLYLCVLSHWSCIFGSYHNCHMLLTFVVSHVVRVYELLTTNVTCPCRLWSFMLVVSVCIMLQLSHVFDPYVRLCCQRLFAFYRIRHKFFSCQAGLGGVLSASLCSD